MGAKRMEQPEAQCQQPGPRREAAHKRRRRERREAGIAHVVPLVVEVCGVTEAAVLGQDRRMHVAFARHLVCYVLVVDGGLTYSEAGKRVGHDHSTVMNSCQRIQSWLETGDPLVLERMADVRRRVWGPLTGAPTSLTGAPPRVIKAEPTPSHNNALWLGIQSVRDLCCDTRPLGPPPLSTPTGRSTLGPIVERQEATREEWELARYYQKRARQREREQGAGVGR